MKFITVLVFLFAANAFAKTRPDSVAYFFGDVDYYSADGKVHYTGTHSLIKRTTSPKNSNIIEELIQPTRVEGKAFAFQSTTTITRVDSTKTLIATDDAHSFIGKMKFKGTDWQWSGWTYSLVLIGGRFDGGKLVGEAKLNEAGLKITKHVFTKDGNSMVIEDLKKISSEEFEACKSILLASTSTTATCN